MKKVLPEKLMLLHNSVPSIRTIDALAVLIRETDIKGWYRNGDMVGVIFTERNSFDRDKFQGKVIIKRSARQARVVTGLRCQYV